MASPNLDFRIQLDHGITPQILSALADLANADNPIDLAIARATLDALIVVQTMANGARLCLAFNRSCDLLFRLQVDIRDGRRHLEFPEFDEHGERIP